MMMDMMIESAKKNMQVLTDMQKRNEEMVRVLLDHTAKTREQIVATNESLLKIAGEQGQAASKFVEESIKVGREMVEKQMADTQRAVNEAQKVVNETQQAVAEAQRAAVAKK